MTAVLQAGWLSDGSTRKVMEALEAERPGCARFVGGCVRNTLLGEPVSDIDIATQLTPDTVSRILKTAGCAVHPTGVEHGTLTVVSNGRPFEVTTLRRDVETDGRRAVVAFTEDWAEDASRRDFTMNALYAAPTGEVYDPTGEGLRDLGVRRIVFVGDPETRLREDYLRILRFFRFHAWYGREAPDAAGLAACQTHAAGLANISAERIWMEVKKLLAAPSPLGGIVAMRDAAVAKYVFETDLNIDRLRRLLDVERTDGAQPDALLRLIALTGPDPHAMRAIARSMKASNEERARLTGPGEVSAPLSHAMEENDLLRIAYRSGKDAVLDRMRIEWADDPAHDADWKALVRGLVAWERPEAPIRGADVIAAGVPEGPEIGPIVRRVEDEWLASDFKLPREALLARIAELASRR